MSQQLQQVQTRPNPPVITSPEVLDYLWEAHRTAKAHAEEAGRRRRAAQERAQQARAGLEQLRAQIAELQDRAAKVETEALAAEVEAEDAAKAEGKFTQDAQQLGATVDYHVAQGRLQHPADRLQLPPTSPVDTQAFKAAQEAAQP